MPKIKWTTQKYFDFWIYIDDIQWRYDRYFIYSIYELPDFEFWFQWRKIFINLYFFLFDNDLWSFTYNQYLDIVSNIRKIKFKRISFTLWITIFRYQILDFPLKNIHYSFFYKKTSLCDFRYDINKSSCRHYTDRIGYGIKFCIINL